MAERMRWEGREACHLGNADWKGSRRRRPFERRRRKTRLGGFKNDAPPPSFDLKGSGSRLGLSEMGRKRKERREEKEEERENL